MRKSDALSSRSEDSTCNSDFQVPQAALSIIRSRFSSFVTVGPVDSGIAVSSTKAHAQILFTPFPTEKGFAQNQDAHSPKRTQVPPYHVERKRNLANPPSISKMPVGPFPNPAGLCPRKMPIVRVSTRKAVSARRYDNRF